MTLELSKLYGESIVLAREMEKRQGSSRYQLKLDEDRWCERLHNALCKGINVRSRLFC
jgi:hypothetical protein